MNNSSESNRIEGAQFVVSMEGFLTEKFGTKKSPGVDRKRELVVGE